MMKHHFTKLHPGVSIAISTVQRDEMLNILDAGYVDMAFIYEQENGDYYFTDSRIKPCNISRKFYGEFEDSFYVGPALKGYTSAEMTVDELSAFPLIVPVTPNSASSYYLRQLRPKGLTDRDFPVDGPMHRLSLARMDLGISYFPDFFIHKYVQNKVLLKVHSEIPMHTSVCYALISNKYPASFALRLFSELPFQPIF